jgi:hypothetical protein
MSPALSAHIAKKNGNASRIDICNAFAWPSDWSAIPYMATGTWLAPEIQIAVPGNKLPWLVAAGP